ncbi:MAG TPA: low affinity iron permease family protein [Methylomirabilota bacterium]|nr:low affinity iron permease family protein [Methylomirabilota bacterium]
MPSRNPSAKRPGPGGAAGRRRRSIPIPARLHEAFEQFARRISLLVGSPSAFILAVLTIVVWSFTGPLFGYSDSWQLIINTGTTIVTFLIVFLIQHTQNKDAHAIQLKLNELIAAVEGASNLLIDIEELSDQELDRLQERFRRLVAHARKESATGGAHSVEEEP